METLWFCLLTLMIVGYVVFDGFDLGAGAIHLWAARTDEERRLVLLSIGPVWAANEVWLIATGGILFFAFPKLFASSFSGFYLPLMIVLWLLILRGVAIEFRNHLRSPAWTPLWDVVFSCSSVLLAVFFGAALANVVRGVPLDPEGRFFEPLWTNFRIGREPGILDWYTISVALTALAAVVMHGALWVHMKTEGPLSARTRAIARSAWIATGVLTLWATIATLRVQPLVAESLARRWWGWIFPAIAVAGWIGVRFLLARERQAGAFLASCGYLVGMLTSAAHGLYPYMLPAVGDPWSGLTVHAVATTDYGLKVGLAWWLPGMVLVALYFAYAYRHFSGRVRLDQDGH